MNLIYNKDLEDYALAFAASLGRLVREAESKDPELRPMKGRIGDLQKKLELAQDSDKGGIQEEIDAAVRSLLIHVTQRWGRDDP